MTTNPSTSVYNDIRSLFLAATLRQPIESQPVNTSYEAGESFPVEDNPEPQRLELPDSEKEERPETESSLAPDLDAAATDHPPDHSL